MMLLHPFMIWLIHNSFYNLCYCLVTQINLYDSLARTQCKADYYAKPTNTKMKPTNTKMKFSNILYISTLEHCGNWRKWKFLKIEESLIHFHIFTFSHDVHWREWKFWNVSLEFWYECWYVILWYSRSIEMEYQYKIIYRKHLSTTDQLPHLVLTYDAKEIVKIR